MQAINWETVKHDFRADGSLRDIYIAPAALTDWQALYALVRVRSDVEFFVDGITQSAPNGIDEIFAVRPSASPMLRFRIGRILIVSHFFSEDEIECDVDPSDLTSQDDLDSLLGFVQQLGDATDKRVIITPENLLTEPFISYSPERRKFDYHSKSI